MPGRCINLVSWSMWTKVSIVASITGLTGISVIEHLISGEHFLNQKPYNDNLIESDKVVVQDGLYNTKASPRGELDPKTVCTNYLLAFGVSPKPIEESPSGNLRERCAEYLQKSGIAGLQAALPSLGLDGHASEWKGWPQPSEASNEKRVAVAPIQKAVTQPQRRRPAASRQRKAHLEASPTRENKGFSLRKASDL